MFLTDEFAPQLLAPGKSWTSSNLSTLIKEQTNTLQCALKFDQAQHIIYFVRSTIPQETENVTTQNHDTHLFEACGPSLAGTTISFFSIISYCFFCSIGHAILQLCF